MIVCMIMYFVSCELERENDMAQMDKRSGNCPSPSHGKETFVVKVEHCENETWQGRVTWAEEKKSVHFRSELELFKLIDGAVKNRQKTKQDMDKENEGTA